MKRYSPTPMSSAYIVGVPPVFPSNTWYLNSGATHHITLDARKFQTSSPYLSSDQVQVCQFPILVSSLSLPPHVLLPFVILFMFLLSLKTYYQLVNFLKIIMWSLNSILTFFLSRIEFRANPFSTNELRMGCTSSQFRLLHLMPKP